MKLLIPLFLFLIISCETNHSHAKVEIIEVSDSAFGYQFAFPSDFIENKESSELFNQFTFESPGKEAKLIYFISELNENQNLTEYSAQLKSGNQTIIPGLKLSEIKFSKDKNQFTAEGNLDINEVFYKAFVSGQSAFAGTAYIKTMIFIYPKERRKYYAPLGILIADKFRDY